MLSRFLVAVAAMVAVVAASNVLVQFPVQASLGGVNIGDILTSTSKIVRRGQKIDELDLDDAEPQRLAGE